MTYAADQRSSRVFKRIVLKEPQKRPFLDTKWARRLETARNFFVVMRFCSPVVLRYLGAGFKPRCRRKEFGTACLLACLRLLLLLLLLLAKTCCSSLDPKRWCKTSTG